MGATGAVFGMPEFIEAREIVEGRLVGTRRGANVKVVKDDANRCANDDQVGGPEPMVSSRPSRHMPVPDTFVSAPIVYPESGDSTRPTERSPSVRVQSTLRCHVCRCDAAAFARGAVALAGWRLGAPRDFRAGRPLA